MEVSSSDVVSEVGAYPMRRKITILVGCSSDKQGHPAKLIYHWETTRAQAVSIFCFTLHVFESHDEGTGI